MNASEFAVLNLVYSSMQDEGTKNDMLKSVMDNTREDNTGHSSINVKSLSEKLDISMNAVKGYVGSLAKKDLVICDHYDDMILVSNKGILAWHDIID